MNPYLHVLSILTDFWDYYLWVCFFENLSRKFVSLKSDKNNRDFTLKTCVDFCLVQFFLE